MVRLLLMRSCLCQQKDDASATPLYGSHAANGMVLMTFPLIV